MALVICRSTVVACMLWFCTLATSLSLCMQHVFVVAAHVLTHSCCLGRKHSARPGRSCVGYASFSPSCFLHRSGILLVDCCNAAWMCQYCSNFWSLHYVHTPGHVCHGNMHFTLQDTLFQGRPGPFWAPYLTPCFCSALQT